MVQQDDIRELRREVERITDRIDDIGNIQVLQVRALGDIRDLVMEYFSGRGAQTKARIYLAADGAKGVTEIADEVGVHKGTVARKCQEMKSWGLLGWHSVGANKCYHKTVVERALNLSGELESIANGT